MLIHLRFTLGNPNHAGGSKDYMVIGSDSGRITIVEYNPTKNTIEKVHQETFGKSGCRRIVPGEYLAVDPKGRAIMIGAVEKSKLVYILNRDSSARLTISSPLEANKSYTLLFDCIGVDVGFENPVFACLEVDYEDAEADPTGEALEETHQMLTYYELDLGLNHVVRKQSDELMVIANKLIRVPGGSDGPSGVLMCSENMISYRNMGGHPEVSVRIPRRSGSLQDPKKSVIIINAVMHKHKHHMFFLLQTEFGDIFKLTLDVDESQEYPVRALTLKYFDTVPVASGISLLKNGLLFVGSEFGNHQLFQVAQLGENEDEPSFSTLSPPGQPFVFTPRELRNLVVMDELENLGPLLKCHIADLASDDSPQLYAACGRGPRSSLRTLRHGLEVTQWAVSPLPGNPNAVWTVKQRASDQYDKYIVVSFVNATLVLSIGETVEEVTDSGFLVTSQTLSASRIGGVAGIDDVHDALIQVYPNGIRHIRQDKRINEWKAPGNRVIVQCAVNERQVAIALAGGEIVYFELDASGQLDEKEHVEMEAEVTSMAVADVPPGLQRSRFLGVGCADSTVRVLSLDPRDTLQPLSMQALPAGPESLSVVEVAGGEGEQATLVMNIGLENGVLLRTAIDTTSGDLSDTRTRYLGSRGVKLFNISVQGSDAVLALSSRPWLSYNHQGHSRLTPLSYEALEHASSFKSEQCQEGIVACARNTLRVLSLERLGTVFNSIQTPLPYTPRGLVVDEASSSVVVVCGDRRTAASASAGKKPVGAEAMESTPDAGAETSPESGPSAAEAVLGERRDGELEWKGDVRLLDPLEGTTFGVENLDKNEVPISVCAMQFANVRDGLTYVLVGTVTDWNIKMQTFSNARIKTYRLSTTEEQKSELEFVHTTPVDGLPAVLHAFNGRLAAGVGNLLRLYVSVYS